MHTYKLKIRLSTSLLVKTFVLRAPSMSAALAEISSEDKVVAITRVKSVAA